VKLASAPTGAAHVDRLVATPQGFQGAPVRISRASLRVLAGYAETFAPNGPIGHWRGGEADAAGIERRVVQPRCRGTGASGHVNRHRRALRWRA
jgi:hypothetical protein